MEILLLLLFAYIFLFGSFEVSAESDTSIRTFKYNGIVWIGLDLYSIKKYKSRDIPMRLFKYEKIIIDENTTGD